MFACYTNLKFPWTLIAMATHDEIISKMATSIDS